MQIKRILVQASGPKLGDFLMMTPALAGLRETYPNISITVLLWSSRPNPWVEGHPLCDAVLGDENDLFSGPVRALRLLRQIRKQDFDAAVAFNSKWRGAWLFRLAGIPIRIGNTGRYYRRLFTTNVCQSRSRADRHDVEYNYDMMRPLGISGAPGPMIYPVTMAQDVVAECLLVNQGWDSQRPLVLINPTWGGTSRKWPSERFAAAAMQIKQATRAQIVLTGSAADRHNNAQIAQAIGDVLDLTGETSIGVLAAILRRSALHLSVDTGTSHLAAACGTPCITVFPFHRHWDQIARWKPWMTERRLHLHGPTLRCTECRPYACNGVGQDCVNSIRVEDVVASALELLCAQNID